MFLVSITLPQTTSQTQQSMKKKNRHQASNSSNSTIHRSCPPNEQRIRRTSQSILPIYTISWQKTSRSPTNNVNVPELHSKKLLGDSEKMLTPAMISETAQDRATWKQS